jgi:large subunit ribosomal protein L24
MKKKFSKIWKASKQPRKQRKYRHNAPIHILGEFISSHLSKELRQKYKKRSARLRTGDKVVIAKGQFKKKSGKVERIDIKEGKAYITGVEVIKKDGTKTTYPIRPSNLIIIELNIDDKKRAKIFERK